MAARDSPTIDPKGGRASRYDVVADDHPLSPAPATMALWAPPSRRPPRTASTFVLFWLCLVLVVVTAAVGAKPKELSREELINFLLGPEFSQWLVGPIARIATEEELARFLELTTDNDAREFIDGFWQKRVDPQRPWPQPQPQGVFEGRALAADRLFTEGTSLGRRTDRGAVFVLYGPAESIGFWKGTKRLEQTIEIWNYSKGAPRGLDEKHPERRYFFIHTEDGIFRHRPPAELLSALRSSS